MLRVLLVWIAMVVVGLVACSGSGAGESPDGSWREPAAAQAEG